MSIDRLKSHYGFTKMPFTKDLAPSMLHRHRAHDEAVARLSWCVAESAVGLLTGEVGSGKTVSARAACSELDPTRHVVIYCATPAVGPRGIYCAVISGLGGVPRFHKSALIPAAQHLLEVESAERGRKVCLVLDEAHRLDGETLDELRCLTNSDMDRHTPVCLLLLGQPMLRRYLALGSFAALSQRVGMRYALSGLDLKETGSYVTHHTRIAGRSDPLYSEDALAVIHEGSRGLPRAINNLATASLVAAFSANKGIVDESAARAALAEVNAE